MLGQRFLPVPDLIAGTGHLSELFVQPDLGNPVDVAQALGKLVVATAIEPSGEGFNDLLASQSRAPRSAHGQNERPTEAGVVGGVELLKALELLGAAVGQARAALFASRLFGERAADHGLAGQFRVRTNQVEPGGFGRLAHDLDQRVVQLHDA